jgi:hypothetical protein
MMEVNMNLSFPIADWLFGTSDLDRGVVGHLLNGYDNRYLKQNLRGEPKRPGPSRSGAGGELLSLLLGARRPTAKGLRSNAE